MASLFAVLVMLCCAGCTAAMGSTAAQIPRPRPAAKPKTRRKARSAAPDLAAALAPLITDDGGHFAVAVDDLTTGEQAAYGGTEEFVTASIVKVDILVTLLYQAQEAGQALTAEDQDLATTMIENSDNDSASALYDDVGGPAAIDDANRVCGLSETTVGTAGYWGLTTTTVDDQVRLLRAVFTRPSQLSPASQAYIQSLMSQVEADQQWGVSAAADPGTRFMVKNGWLPNPYLWEINSIGEVTHGGQRLLIAVLSDDNASESSGISLVEAVARRAADAVTG
jgi:beta-lactamase class A